MSKNKMGFVLNAVQSQLTTLIEKYEPQLETSLRNTLTNIKQSNPNEAALFLQQWTKLNNAVQETLGQPTMGGMTIGQENKDLIQTPANKVNKAGRRSRKTKRNPRRRRV
jgi:hypothetical protein